METVKGQKEEPLVSITCITYNHGVFIAQTIESFLMQKTNFPFEILIGEDCSTDNTRLIIQEYCKKYPNLITLVTSEKNVGARKNGIRIRERAKGKYIAMCEGDDYWTDPLKLQKQVDFLESHNEYAMCCHYTKVVDKDGKLIFENSNPTEIIYQYEDILLGKKRETRTSSVLVRNGEAIKQLNANESFLRFHNGDWFFKLFITKFTNKKIYVLPEVMSCYRLHEGGVWSLIHPKEKIRKKLNDFNIVIKHFDCSPYLKKKMLNIYVKRYLFSDIRNFKIKNALKTISTLV